MTISSFNIISSMTIINKIKKNNFIKYTFFAVITSLLNIAVYYLIYNYVIGNILVSNVCAYSLSISSQFIINKVVVFCASKEKISKQFALFIITKIIAFLIDSIVLILCNNLLHIPNLISKIISNSSTTLSNYSLNKKVVFK